MYDALKGRIISVIEINKKVEAAEDDIIIGYSDVNNLYYELNQTENVGAVMKQLEEKGYKVYGKKAQKPRRNKTTSIKGE